jgi:UDP-3-O-[3-hydroxymyristoyl] N-acetylglucosamine deacetylase
MLEHLRQKTVHTQASVRGVALHSGEQVQVTLRPAPVDTGVVFNRVDVRAGLPIEAAVRNIVDTSRATTLGVGELRISTVEHMLSALRGLGVDNAFVDVDGAELPALDGSAACYVELVKRAGVRTQRAFRRLAVLRQTVEVHVGDRWARLEPAPTFGVSCSIDFAHPLIGRQAMQVDFSQLSYEREIASARTFAFFREVQWLREHGLARGGSLDNCVVLDEEQVLNPGGLRYPDEFVRHKVLDAVGDLSLFGAHLIGHLTCHRSGHEVHRALAEALVAQPQAYDLLVPRAQRTLDVRGLQLPVWAPAAEPIAA